MGNMKQVTQKGLQITLCSCKSCIAKSVFMAVLKSFHYNTSTNFKKHRNHAFKPFPLTPLFCHAS